MGLRLNFTDENSAAINNDGETRIEITFHNPAANLTRRAKVEIALAARAAYTREAARIANGKLMPSHVFNEDGSIGTEPEVRPVSSMM